MGDISSIIANYVNVGDHFNDVYTREDYDNTFADYNIPFAIQQKNEKHYPSDYSVSDYPQFYTGEDYDNTLEDYLIFGNNQDFVSYSSDIVADYFPDFSTCFISQNKVRNFQVICYLKFYPETKSRRLDSDFFKIFEKSMKSSVFWAHCDLASNVDHYIDTKYIGNGKVELDSNSWEFNWWERDFNIHIY